MPGQKKISYAMSKFRRTCIIAVCLLAFLSLVWLDHSFLGGGRLPQNKSDEQAEISDFEKYHDKAFVVIKVVDGDTVDIDIPDGKYDYTRIRLLGIDAPETHNPETGAMYFGFESSEFVSRLVLGKQTVVYLDENNNTRGKYGRLLAYIKLPDERFLNEVLLTEGFVYADLRFRHSFYNKYKQLEASARSLKKGLWENVTRSQLPEWLQREKPTLLKK